MGMTNDADDRAPERRILPLPSDVYWQCVDAGLIEIAEDGRGVITDKFKDYLREIVAKAQARKRSTSDTEGVDDTSP